MTGLARLIYSVRVAVRFRRGSPCPRGRRNLKYITNEAAPEKKKKNTRRTLNISSTMSRVSFSDAILSGAYSDTPARTIGQCATTDGAKISLRIVESTRAIPWENKNTGASCALDDALARRHRVSLFFSRKDSQE